MGTVQQDTRSRPSLILLFIEVPREIKAYSYFERPIQTKRLGWSFLMGFEGGKYGLIG